MSDPLAQAVRDHEDETPDLNEQEKGVHPANRRRDHLRAIQFRFGSVAIRQGTEQSAAIVKLIDEFTALAQVLEVRCADGREKDLAMDHLLQAKMLATHAISHRGRPR